MDREAKSNQEVLRPLIQNMHYCFRAMRAQGRHGAQAMLGHHQTAGPGVPKVKGAREETRGSAGQQRKRGDIGIDSCFQADVLHLHSHLPPVRQPRLMHLMHIM